MRSPSSGDKGVLVGRLPPLPLGDEKGPVTGDRIGADPLRLHFWEVETANVRLGITSGFTDLGPSPKGPRFGPVVFSLTVFSRCQLFCVSSVLANFVWLFPFIFNIPFTFFWLCWFSTRFLRL